MRIPYIIHLGETILYFGLKSRNICRFYSFSRKKTTSIIFQGFSQFIPRVPYIMTSSKGRQVCWRKLNTMENGQKQTKIFLKSLLTNMTARHQTNLFSTESVVINNLLAKAICFFKNNVLLRAKDNWKKTLKCKRPNRVNWNPASSHIPIVKIP